MDLKVLTWPQSVPNCFIQRAPKINPNQDFWFENIPSGNPGSDTKICFVLIVSSENKRPFKPRFFALCPFPVPVNSAWQGDQMSL
jgi:hypothetical protein